MLVADCSLLRSKNSELMNQIQEINNHIYQMEQALHVLNFKEALQNNTGLLTQDNINDILCDLNLQYAITDHIHTSTDWDDVVEVELSLSGNEIETQVDSDHWKIDRYISQNLASKLEESLREILENFIIQKQEVSDDSI